jgi:hypothetical protein
VSACPDYTGKKDNYHGTGLIDGAAGTPFIDLLEKTVGIFSSDRQLLPFFTSPFFAIPS